MVKLEAPEFLALDQPSLDTRSPSEYMKAHIPGAHSLPLFSDEERAQVGTCYKQVGQKEAIKLGLELVGPKMRGFIEQAERFGSEALRIYCWRGGMRSSSMGWLLEQYGFEVHQLVGGYKKYRRYLFSLLEKPLNLRVLTGYTGSGKTEVLKEMEKLGAQVVDLEGLANHPGSSFGNALGLEQPSTEMFQNQVLAQIAGFDLDRPIWLEDESICIGQVHLPEKLYQMMQESPSFFLQASSQERIKLLVRQYGQIGNDRLKQATQNITKKLGSDKASAAIEAIERGDLEKAAETLLVYYDRQYQKSMKTKDNTQISEQSTKAAADYIVNTYGS